MAQANVDPDDFVAARLGPQPYTINYNQNYLGLFKSSWTLSEAYYGENPVLTRTVISGFHNPRDFLLAEALPTREVPFEGEHRWEVIKFDQQVLNVTPEFGTSRLVQSQYNRHRKAYERRGIALMVEDDFAATEKGRQQFDKHIVQINSCTTETFRLSTVRCLRSCRALDDLFYRIQGQRKAPVTSLSEFERDIVDTWCILQKPSAGFDVLFQMALRKLALASVQPDMVIMPPGAMGAATLGNRDHSYFMRGSAGNAIASPARSADLAAVIDPMDTLYGCKIRECNYTKDGQNFGAGDPLSRTKVIGEMAFMRPIEFVGAADTEYQTAMRDIFMHSEDTDRFERVRFRDCVQSSSLLFDDGIFANAQSTELQEGGKLLGQLNREGVLKGSLDSFFNGSEFSRLVLKYESSNERRVQIMQIFESARSTPYTVRRLMFTYADVQYNSVMDIVTKLLDQWSGDGNGYDGNDHKFDHDKLHAAQSRFFPIGKLQIPVFLVLNAPDVAPGDVPGLFARELGAVEKPKDNDNTKREKKELNNLITNSVNTDSDGSYTLDVYKVLKSFEIFLRFISTFVVHSRSDPDAPGATTASGAGSDSDKISLADSKGQLQKYYEYLPFLKSAILQLCDGDLPIPFSFVLMRPYMAYNMSSAIVMKSGTDTGENLYSNASFVLGKRADVKVVYGHFTVHMCSVVRAEENVCVLRDVRCNAYLGGGGVQLISKTGEVPKRPEFNSPCMFPILVHYRSKIFNANKANVTHRDGAGFEAFDYETQGDVTQSLSLPLSKPVSPSDWDDDQASNIQPCYLCTHTIFNTTTNAHDLVVPGIGHWKSDVYNGVGAARQGKERSIRHATFAHTYAGASGTNPVGISAVA